MDEPTSQAVIRLYHDPGSPPIVAAVLDTRTGAPLQVITGATATVPLAVTADATGRVFALTPTTVRVLNPRTGATLHVFPLSTGGFPATLVVDARDHRAWYSQRAAWTSMPRRPAASCTALPTSAVDEAAMYEQTDVCSPFHVVPKTPSELHGQRGGTHTGRGYGPRPTHDRGGRNPSAVAIDTVPTASSSPIATATP